MAIVNERIKHFRETFKVPQEEFSERTGIPLKRLQKLESDRIRAKLGDIVAIQDAYGVSADYLLGRCEDVRPILKSAAMADVWAKVLRMKPEQLGELLDQFDDESTQ